MSERRFDVFCHNDRLASYMTLDDALMFIEAYFNKYYSERGLILSIKEMERTEACKEDVE